MPNRTILAGYVPVIHKGYLRFFEQYKFADVFYVFDDSTLKLVDYIRKDIRALSPAEQKNAISGLGIFSKVEIVTPETIKTLDNIKITLVLPDEDVSREFAKQHLQYAKVEFYPVFLRWDRDSVDANEEAKTSISARDFDIKVMQKAMKQAGHSTDIWRRVGAVLVLNNKITAKASNTAETSQHSPSIEGDPRNVFNRGVAIEMSVFTHAEALLIAEAAKSGTALQDASLYVTTFPCPSCAKLIAHSGITTCYYASGYAVLDGLRVLKDYGVKVVKVDLEEQPKGPEFVPYIK